MHVKLHPVASVIAGVILFPWHQAADVMRGYDALVPAMPDELTVQIGVISGPDGQPVVYLSPVWSGNPAEGHLLPRHENFAPCQTKCRPHTQPPPQTAAHRARQICLIGMAEGQRVVSSPGSPSRSSQRGASPPPRTWRARPTGVLVIDCFSRALSTGAPDGCDRDRGQRWLGVAGVDVRARALLPSRLYHYSGTHCSS
jgi:hypothetical protein